VEPGETVYSISRRYQIPPATLMAVNNLSLPATLAVGQVLVLNSQITQPVAAPVSAPAARAGVNRPNPAIYVPKTAAPQAAPVPTAAAGVAIQHTVAKGETLYSISKLYKVSLADLQAWNAKLDQNVKIGEVLQIKSGLK
jgi:membrane-bound lytic murein transglycosylase D